MNSSINSEQIRTAAMHSIAYIARTNEVRTRNAAGRCGTPKTAIGASVDTAYELTQETDSKYIWLDICAR